MRFVVTLESRSLNRGKCIVCSNSGESVCNSLLLSYRLHVSFLTLCFASNTKLAVVPSLSTIHCCLSASSHSAESLCLKTRSKGKEGVSALCRMASAAIKGAALDELSVGNVGIERSRQAIAGAICDPMTAFTLLFFVFGLCGCTLLHAVALSGYVTHQLQLSDERSGDVEAKSVVALHPCDFKDPIVVTIARANHRVKTNLFSCRRHRQLSKAASVEIILCTR